MAELATNEILNPPPSTQPNAGAPVKSTPAPSEAAQDPKAEPKASDDRVSSKLHTLVKREKLALNREQAARAKEAEVEAKIQALVERERKVTEFETLKATNPKKAYELLGLSYQDLTAIELNDGNVPPEVQIKKVEEKFDRFVTEQEEKSRRDADEAKSAAAAQEQQVTQEFRGEIGRFVDANPKDYELIRFEGQQELIYDVIDAHYERTIDPKTGVGKIMSIKESADKVEAHLEKKYNEALALEKLKPKVLPANQTQPAKPQPTTSQKPTTMTNRMSATPTKPRTSVLTDEERIQKAIAYAQGLRP